MAKVSELIEQARTLEAQGESAKALAVYQHVLPHLDGMPAIKADLSLKAGDLMIKLGNTAGALAMYESAGAQCANHGSTKGVLTVASKIQAADPARRDILLSFAGQMVQHGHANHAVEVLIQHARQANLQQMLQELEPLAGRPAEDVRPQVQMLLEQPTPSVVAPPPATPSLPPRPRYRAAPPGPKAPVPPPPAPPPTPGGSQDDLRLQTTSWEDELASVPVPKTSTPAPSSSPLGKFTPPPPPAPPPPVVPPLTAQTTGSGPPYVPPDPPVNPFLAPPSPSSTLSEAPLDLSPVLPPSARESVAMNARTLPTEETVEEPRHRPSQRSIQMPRAPARRRVSPMVWFAIPAAALVVVVALGYLGMLPASIAGLIPGLGPRRGPSPVDSVFAPRVATPTPGDSQVPPAGQEPAPVRPVAPPEGFPSRAAADDQLLGGRPPVYIEGLRVTDFAESNAGFSVVQQQPGGQYLTIQGRPLADTIGEPAVGEFRESQAGDTAQVITNFEGYLVTVRGVIAPAALQTLLLQLVARPN